MTPGFKKARVSPQLSGLEWMRGAVPTPFGSIEIEADASGAKITAPDGIEIVKE